MMSAFPIHRVLCATMLLLTAGRTAEAQLKAKLYVRPDGSRAPSGQARELVCRGKPGIDLRIEREQVPERPGYVTMILRYDRPREQRSVGQEGMGTVDYGRSVQFSPGSCTWNMGGFEGIPSEPGVVYFDLPRDAQTHVGTGQRDTTVNAAVTYPDLVSVPRYLSDSSRFWLFYVNDATNVSISFRSSELVTHGSTGYVAGSLRDAAAGSATLPSARVLADSGPRTTAVHTPSVGGTLRGSGAGSATASSTTVLRDSVITRSPSARVPAPATGAAGPLRKSGSSTARAGADAPAPTTRGGVAGPLRDTSPGTASASGDRALPTDTAVRRTATVRTPLPTPASTGARPLRGASPGTVTPSTSRATSTDTSAKVPDAARARSPQLRVNRVYDVRIAPGPLGVRLTFNARGAGSTGIVLNLSVYDPAGGIVVQFSRTRPSWNERERQWSYPTGGSPWAGPVRLAADGRFEAEPFSKLTNGELYYYLITVHGSDPSAPPGQRTGSFTADVRTPLDSLFK